MSALCAVCGLTGSARLMELASGKRIGPFCPGECSGLGWEAHFNQATGATSFEKALTLWGWRKRRAEAEGRTFLEPAPLMPAEKLLLRLTATVGQLGEHADAVAQLMAGARQMKRGVA